MYTYYFKDVVYNHIFNSYEKYLQGVYNLYRLHLDLDVCSLCQWCSDIEISVKVLHKTGNYDG